MSALNRHGNPQRILDLLEVDGGWMTLRQLEAEFTLRWPQVGPPTMQRAAQRLIHRGTVEVQWVTRPGFPNQQGKDCSRRVRALRVT